MISLLLLTGYTDLFMRFAGVTNDALNLKLTHGIGLLMVAFFAYLYFGLYRKLSKAVISDDVKGAAAVMMKMRPVMATNLILGMLLTAIGISGSAI